MSLTNPSYEDICNEIKERVSLVDEMEKNGLTLRASGLNRKKCVCPFHPDNDPSLVVNLQDDVEWFHCFGCHASGTVIDFIMLLQDVPLSGAVRYFSENYTLEFDKNIDLKDLLIRTVNKKERISVQPYYTRASRMVKVFLDKSENPLKDLNLLKPYLKEIDTAASVNDYIVMIEMMNILSKEISLIEKIKEKNTTS